MNKATETGTAESDRAAVRQEPLRGPTDPYEPAVPDPTSAGSRDTLLALTSFLAHGGSHQERIPSDAWPAQMHRYRDLAGQRLPWPLVLSDEHSVTTLGTRIDALADALINDSGLEGDAAEHIRHDLRRAESQLRREPAMGMQGLREQWQRSTDALIENAGTKNRQRISHNLEAANQRIGPDETLLGLDPGSTRLLAEHLLRTWWRSHSSAWRSELAELVGRLADLLRAEQDRSDQGRSPDKLAHTVGTADAEDLDFATLSDILGRSHLDQPLPDERHARIQAVLTSLAAATQAHEADGGIGDHAISFVSEDCQGALTECRRRLDALVDQVRNVAVARLELENRYVESRHDEHFRRFDISHLDAQERALCPPTLLVLDGDRARDQMEEFLQLLTSDRPVKILLELDTATLDPGGWLARLGSMAVGLNQPFVFQGTAADPVELADNLRRAFEHPGPALMIVQRPDDATALPAFLQAAAVLESRLLAAFRYDPAAGSDLASRARLLANPSPDLAWSSESFSFTDAAGEQKELELAFTVADLMAVTRNFQEHFWCVPPALWHPRMRPLEAFLAADDSEREGTIPYVLLVTSAGELLRAVPDRSVVDAVLRQESVWRLLQETCGVANSHARRLLEREQARLAAERDEAIDQVRAEYDQQLQQDVGELSRQIVSNIAEQLLATEGSLPAPPAAAGRSASPATPRTPTPVEEPEEEPAEPEEAQSDDSEAQFVLDDPYIDTALCTTCDDCTSINSEMFGYDENKQAYIKDPSAGPFRDLVLAAEKCPVNIIHPGKPANPDEPDLEKWVERAKPYQ